MALFYPDVSAYQMGESLISTQAVCARATEGNWLADSFYPNYKTQAKQYGIPLLAYHFLESLSPAGAQASFCHSVVGSVPLMLDLEGYGAVITRPQGYAAGMSGKRQVRNRLHRIMPASSYPSLTQAITFIDAYRNLGGTCYMLYLPQWYWSQLGSPSLHDFAKRGMALVSSNYTSYSDSGPGWASYGGMSPVVWQYTDSGPGQYSTDWNAFKGVGGSIPALVTQLQGLWQTGRVPEPGPQESEDTMMILSDLPTGGPATCLLIPSGKSKLRIGVDAGMANSLPVQLRIGFGPKWTDISPVKPSWNSSPLTYSIPAGCTKVTICRLDTGNVPVTVDFE